MRFFWFIIICFCFNTYIGRWAGSDLLVAGQLDESNGKLRICDHRWHEDDDWVECQPCIMWCYGHLMNLVRFVVLKRLQQWARYQGTTGVLLVVVRRGRYMWLGNLDQFRMSFVAIQCWSWFLVVLVALKMKKEKSLISLIDSGNFSVFFLTQLLFV